MSDNQELLEPSSNGASPDATHEEILEEYPNSASPAEPSESSTVTADHCINCAALYQEGFADGWEFYQGMMIPSMEAERQASRVATGEGNNRSTGQLPHAVVWPDGGRNFVQAEAEPVTREREAEGQQTIMYLNGDLELLQAELTKMELARNPDGSLVFTGGRNVLAEMNAEGSRARALVKGDTVQVRAEEKDIATERKTQVDGSRREKGGESEEGAEGSEPHARLRNEVTGREHKLQEETVELLTDFWMEARESERRFREEMVELLADLRMEVAERDRKFREDVAELNNRLRWEERERARDLQEILVALHRSLRG